MSQEVAVRTVRSGAKSCEECRRRKIRCIWSPSSDAIAEGGLKACNHCSIRGLICVPQIQRPRAQRGKYAVRSSADRDRIGSLERDLAALAALVRDSNALKPSASTSPDDQDGTSLYSDLANELDRPEIEGAFPPSHLRLLFKELAVDSPGDGDTNNNHRSTVLIDGFMSVAREKLQTLLPSREEVTNISESATEWMALHYSFVPSEFAIQTKEQLVTNYDPICNNEVHPVVLAMYVLTVAITVQQAPRSSILLSFNRGQGVARYVDAVCRVVDQTIVANNALVASAEGLDTAMLFVRLLLGRGDHKNTWLTFRRVLSVAELMGLSQANDAISNLMETSGVTETSHLIQPSLRAKADIWEAICTTDRSMSMMLNFPPGTTRYRFPRDQSVWRDKQFSARAYYHRLSNVSAMTFEIDESYIRGLSQAESYEKVLRADRELRALAALAPANWWLDIEGLSLDHQLTKFWHYYILARVHLRPAMMNDFDQQFAFSHSACRDACGNAARRFLQVRSRVPSGFYICRVLDLQAFTAATFLILSSGSSYRENNSAQLGSSLDPSTAQLIEDVIACFQSVSNQAGADLAFEAKGALRALLSHVQGDFTEDLGSATLQIPLLGKVHLKQPITSASNSQSPDPAGTESLISGFSSNPGLNGEQSHGPGLGVAGDPALWSFEFDEPSLWMANDQLMDNMTGMEYWQM